MSSRSATAHRLAAGLLLGALALWSGCATASKPEAMVYTPAGQVLQKHASTVSVNVTGGSTTSAMGASQISNEDFAQAITRSIVDSGVFANVLPADQAGFHLEVGIVRMNQPLMGFSMTVTMETNWTLTHRSTRETVWRKAIVGQYTASAGAAFAGVTRLRLANEGAARASIQQALQQLSELPIP